MPASQTARDTILGMVRERIVSYATSRIGREDAEELANDTLLLLHTKYGHLESEVDLVPLAVAIMKKKIQEVRRDKDRGHAALETTPQAAQATGSDTGPELTAYYEQLRARILEAVEILGGRCREMFLLKLEGYTFPEIQERMGANSIDTVYTWDFRCRAQLRKLMEGYRK